MSYVIIDRLTRQVWNHRTGAFQARITPATLYKGRIGRRGCLIPSAHCELAHENLHRIHTDRELEVNILSRIIEDNAIFSPKIEIVGVVTA